MEAHILARAAITYTGVDGTTQHAPLVAASVGDVEMLFVLDTGSDTHILTKELVDRLGLDVDEGEEGIDHSGATMPSWSIADLSLTLGGSELGLREIVSVPALGEFNRLGDRWHPEPAVPAPHRLDGARPDDGRAARDRLRRLRRRRVAREAMTRAHDAHPRARP